MAKSVLLAGETWTSTATHIKGFDQFPTVTYHNGAEQFLRCLGDSDYRVVPHAQPTRRRRTSRWFSRT